MTVKVLTASLVTAPNSRPLSESRVQFFMSEEGRLHLDGPVLINAYGLVGDGNYVVEARRRLGYEFTTVYQAGNQLEAWKACYVCAFHGVESDKDVEAAALLTDFESARAEWCALGWESALGYVEGMMKNLSIKSDDEG